MIKNPINLKFISIDKNPFHLQRNILCSYQSRNCIRCSVYRYIFSFREFPA